MLRLRYQSSIVFERRHHRQGWTKFWPSNCISNQDRRCRFNSGRVHDKLWKIPIRSDTNKYLVRNVYWHEEDVIYGSDHKLEKLLAAIRLALSHSGELCSAKQLSSIAGQLSAMSIALGPLVRFMTRAIYHAIVQSASWYALFSLPAVLAVLCLGTLSRSIGTLSFR